MRGKRGPADRPRGKASRRQQEEMTVGGRRTRDAGYDCSVAAGPERRKGGSGGVLMMGREGLFDDVCHPCLSTKQYAR
jgi:hypothetical protein